MFIQHCVVSSHKFQKTESFCRISGGAQTFCVSSEFNALPATINNGYILECAYVFHAMFSPLLLSINETVLVSGVPLF